MSAVSSWLSAALLGLLFAAGAAQAQTPLPALSHTLVAVTPRVPAPAIRLADMDGKPHDLAAYRGRVVLVNFWATWCPPCRREMPSMERVHQHLKAQPFAVLAVDVGEPIDMVFSFLGSLELQPTFPILFDLDSAVLKRWPVRGLPTTFIVDKKGRIAYQAIGGREFDHPDIVKQITALMNER